jgi:outer membrane protein TolC
MLDAQRSLYSSRQRYVVLQLSQLLNQVNLYKALGGGWKKGNAPKVTADHSP